LHLIFRHELTHYKRRDLWRKLALTALRCLYWYNPAVHLMARQINIDMETVCDGMATQGMDITGRKEYGHLILRMAGSPAQSALTTHISGGAILLKQRINNILNGNGNGKRKGGRVFLAAAAAVLLTAGFLVGLRFGPGIENGEERAVTAYTYDSAANDYQYINDVTVSPQRDNLYESLLSAQAGVASNMAAPWNVFTSNHIRVQPYESPEYGDIFAKRSARREAAGLITHANTHRELYALVYPKPRLTEYTFNHIDKLYIDARHDDIRITQGGDTYIIRYHEWLEGHYILSGEDGNVRLEYAMPYYSGPYMAVDRTLKGTSSSTGDHISHDSWLMNYLQPLGEAYAHTIEIIVPEGTYPNIEISSAFNDIHVNGVRFSEMDIDVSFGNVFIDLIEIHHLYDIKINGRQFDTFPNPNDSGGDGKPARLRVNGRIDHLEITDPNGSVMAITTQSMGNIADYNSIRYNAHYNFPAGGAHIGVYLTETVSGGVMITDIVPGTGADKADLQPGDVMAFIDAAAIRSQTDLQRFLAAAKSGQEVVIGIIRDGEKLEVPVILGIQN
jgi:hypothetical protein